VLRISDTRWLFLPPVSISMSIRLKLQDLSRSGPFPTDPTGHGAEHGHFYLTQASGSELSLGASDEITPASALAIEANHDIEYEWSAATSVPRNPRHKVGSVMVPEPHFSLSIVAGALSLWVLARRRITPHYSVA